MPDETRFQHDCDQCVPLGQLDRWDLYYCSQSGDNPTIVARFGDDGPDYESGRTILPFLVEQIVEQSRERERALRERLQRLIIAVERRSRPGGFDELDAAKEAGRAALAGQTEQPASPCAACGAPAGYPAAGPCPDHPAGQTEQAEPERLFGDVRTVVEHRDGSEMILDYDASVRLADDHSPSAPKSWRVERRKVTNWVAEQAEDGS